MPDEKAPIKKQLFDPKRWQLTEHAVHSWTVTVEEGTTLDDVLDPAFFAHYARDLGIYDEITVRTDDGAWYAKLLVCSCGRTWAKTTPIVHLHLTTRDVDMSQAEAFDGYEVKFRGPVCKWSVIRKQDAVLVFEKGEDKASAQHWLTQHVQATAAK